MISKKKVHFFKQAHFTDERTETQKSNLHKDIQHIRSQDNILIQSTLHQSICLFHCAQEGISFRAPDQVKREIAGVVPTHLTCSLSQGNKVLSQPESMAREGTYLEISLSML